MSNFFDKLFSPLSKDYCLYFYFLSIIGLILFVLTILSTLFIGIMKKKDFAFFLQGFLISLVYLLLYFVNRLLNGVCVSSLK